MESTQPNLKTAMEDAFHRVRDGKQLQQEFHDSKCHGKPFQTVVTFQGSPVRQIQETPSPMKRSLVNSATCVWRCVSVAMTEWSWTTRDCPLWSVQAMSPWYSLEYWFSFRNSVLSLWTVKDVNTHVVTCWYQLRNSCQRPDSNSMKATRNTSTPWLLSELWDVALWREERCN